ncbi:MAG: ABC transporter permease [Trueperaceae bacterium]|nr:ABC transporter permease [Trueperaceae bacterium]
MHWNLALASLRHRPLRTLLTALGIAVAVASTVVFMSIGEGLRKTFADQLSRFGPDLQVAYGSDYNNLLPSADLPIEYLAELRSRSREFGLKAVVPFYTYLRGGLSPTQSFVFQGVPVDTALEDLFGSIKLVEGRMLDATDDTTYVALVGKSVAGRSNIGVGSILRLNPSASLEVVGLIDGGGGLVDNLIVMPLSSLQRATDVHDRLSSIVIDLEDPLATEPVAAQIRAAYPELGVRTASSMVEVIGDSLRISDFIRLGISAIALLVGAIAVANTMMMSVFERTKEFGVVRAVGAKPRFLFRLVIVESLALSLAGAAVGLLVGYLTSELLNVISLDYIGLAVSAVTPRLLLFAVAVAFVVGLIAGLLPASRAARIPIATAVARE